MSIKNLCSLCNHFQGNRCIKYLDPEISCAVAVSKAVQLTRFIKLNNQNQSDVLCLHFWTDELPAQYWPLVYKIVEFESNSLVEIGEHY